MRVAGFCRRSLFAVGACSASFYATESVASSSLFRRLGQLHSSQQASEQDLSSLVDTITRGELSSTAQRALSWRTLGGASFLVPLVDNETKLLTFPDSSTGGQIFGVFSSNETFQAVRAANKDMKVSAKKMSAEQLLDALKQLSNPAAPASARVTKLSIDAKLVFDWPGKEMLWKHAVDTAWCRSTLQLASTSEEIDVAAVQVLSDRGHWLVAEHRQANGTFAPSLNELNAREGGEGVD